MPFVVRVASEKAGEEKFLEGRSTRKAAVAPACKLISQGIEGVTLMDEDGRVCRGIQCMIDAFVHVPGSCKLTEPEIDFRSRPR
jgi:hypothetical protein